MKIKPTTMTRIFNLREKFAPISNVSFIFSKINKTYPLDEIDEEQAEELIKSYEQLLDKIRSLKV